MEGLQNTLCQRKIRLQKIKSGVQIIHDRGNHWIVASSINECNGKVIDVYDSLYDTINDETAEVIKLLFETATETQIHLAGMQK